MMKMFGKAALLASALAFGGQAQAAPIFNPANGHYYDFIAGGLTWQAALAGAAAATPIAGYNSYLVTITSAAENQFIFDNVQAGGFWTSGTDQAVEGTFRWAAGPELGQIFFGPGAGAAFSNFGGGEPNDNPCCGEGGEDFVHLFPSSLAWNDLASTNFGFAGFVQGYVVEYSQAPMAGVPEPATWAMLITGFGLVGGAMRRRSKVAVTYA
jgi:hypothetical protein